MIERPHITVWSLFLGIGSEKELQRKLLGEGSYFADWNSSSRLDPKGSASAETGISHSGSQCSTEKGLQSFVSDNRQCVSSSMVISEKMYVPYAAVYGFFSGEIEIAKFDFLHRLDSCASSPRSDTDSLVSRQRLLGHTGFVLSLAAHRMFRDANGCNSSHVDLRKYGLHHPHLAPCVCLYLN
ncbi:unnamed protein product [Arabidopsis arenosa]|uniref:Uncharacterized protein n=1 Tax=Arabidopsis arenosa TaxID=38785 RepID=A0A8S2AV40_ARAAE|nr:unnamed protein product [Arabidopsis arenosa]